MALVLVNVVGGLSFPIIYLDILKESKLGDNFFLLILSEGISHEQGK